MFATKRVRRVVIIVDATLQSQMLDKIMDLGAKGYNVVECYGKGQHAVTGDAFGRSELVRIETIVSEPVAGDILEYIHATQFSQFGRYALAAYVDDVEVDARDKSLA